jgi:hypothetical protein
VNIKYKVPKDYLEFFSISSENIDNRMGNSSTKTFYEKAFCYTLLCKIISYLSYANSDTNQLEKRLCVKERCYSGRPNLFLQQASGQIVKDDVNGFSSTSDIYFMLLPLANRFTIPKLS